MSSSHIRFTPLIAALLVVMAAAPTHAQTPPQDIIAPSLVYLKIDYIPTKGTANGVPQTDQATGFFVSDDGFILTSYHLLERLNAQAGTNVTVTASLGSPEGAAVTAAIVNGVQPLDVLLLKIRPTSHPYAAVKLGTAEMIDTNAELFTSGFHGTEPFSKHGTLANKVGPLGIGYLWAVNMSVSAGESGSPVYLGDSTVVGILKGQNNDDSSVGYMVPIEFADSLIVHLRLRELQELVAAVPHQCRICFSSSQDGNGRVCSGALEGCSDWSNLSSGSASPGWSPELQFVPGNGFSCSVKWKVDCK